MNLTSSRTILLLLFILFFCSENAQSQLPNCPDQTFFKTLGHETQSEFGTVLAPSSDGALYLAGRKTSKTFIQKMDYSGKPIWLREFQIGSFEPITPVQIFEDSEGKIVGCGTQTQFAGARRGFVFRYDPVADSFLWAHPVASSNPRAAGILEKEPGGSYIYYQNPLPATAGGDDMEILNLERATGTIIPAFAARYEYKSSDVLAKMVVVNGSLYGLGTVTGKTEANDTRRRLMMARFNPVNGTPLWAQLSHIDTNITMDFIARDLIADADTLIAAYLVDEGSDFPPGESGPYLIYLQKTDLDGNVLWVKRYDTEMMFNPQALRVLAVADGYVVSGQGATGQNHFVFKVNKNGAFKWGRRLDYDLASGIDYTFNGPNQSIAVADSLYFTGYTHTGVAPNVMLWKMRGDGYTADSCGYIQGFNLEVINVPPVVTPIALNKLLSSAVTTDVDAPWTSSALEESLICPDCSDHDPCPEDNDYGVLFGGVSCVNGKIKLSLSFCEFDEGYLSDGLSYTIYNGNPFLSAADKLYTYTYDSISGALIVTCKSDMIPDLMPWFNNGTVQDGMTLYVVINDPGTLQTPYSLNDFPLAHLAECNYTNNMDSVTIHLPTFPTLSLGPDLAVCPEDVTTLDAGPGFYKYQWSNGQTTQTTNVSFGGQYRVTVTDDCGYKQIDTINVQILPQPQLFESGEFCPGKSVTVHGFTFDDDGVFQRNVPSNGPGCDTLLTVTITKLPYEERSQTVFFCPFQTVTINGVVYEDSQLVRDTVEAATGCDTIVLYFLQQLPLPFRFFNINACEGDTVIFNGNLYTTSVGFTDTLQSNTIGCDTVAYVAITFFQQITLRDTLRFCPGQTVVIDGQTYTQPGEVISTLPNPDACDTLVIHTLEWLPSPAREEIVQFCAGSSVVIDGQTYTQPGTVMVTIPDPSGGCDSLITYILEWLPTPTRDETVSFCPGRSVTIGGQTYTQPGVVTLSIPGANGGCDTLVTYTLEWLPTPTKAETVAFCPGTTVIIGGQSYTQPTVVTLTVPGTNSACDTLVTYTLEWLSLPTRTETILFCPGQTVVVGGNPYTQPGTVLDTIPSNGVGCDTVVTYTLNFRPLPTRSETIEFCKGGSVTLGGQTYTQPGAVTLTVAGANGNCDTLVTYNLQYLAPPPSVLQMVCPQPLVIVSVPGTGPVAVNYGLPTTSSNCVCPGIAVAQSSGPASGSLFPVGTTEVCYTAKDSCGSTAKCCFGITVREELPCDTKTNGCIKYEMLAITADAEKNYTYRIRVTNTCANKLIYTAIELPEGITALSPANLSTYTSPDGRKYEVRNPNFSPFYSIRFKALADGIANGQSDVFEFSLPGQTPPTFFNITTKLDPQTFYAAHLNTFNCPIGTSPSQNREAPGAAATSQTMETRVLLFPNPSKGELFADLTGWTGQNLKLRVLDSRGKQIQMLRLDAAGETQQIPLETDLPAGLYFLEILPEQGERVVTRFVIAR